ncbi:MAG: hypothetical protein KAR38_10385 [Calditrichia bacterium]|nr:hypothetical protein [Calditrichia bacterium]
MKKILLLILAVSIATSIFAQEKRFIGVLGLEQSSLSEEDASILTNRLRYELFKTEKFVVLERDKMEEIMSEQSFQLSGCTSTECLVEVGKLIGVSEIAGGSIGKFGETYTINVRMIDVETGQITANAVFDLSGSKDDLLTKGMRKVARELAGLKTEEKSEEKVTLADTPVQQKTIPTQTQTDKSVDKSENKPVVKQSKPYVRRGTSKKAKKFKYFAIYPTLGVFNTTIKTDKLFDALENKVEVDFNGTLAGVIGEVFLTKKMGIFLGIFSSSKSFSKIKINSLTYPLEYDVDVTMFYWGIDWKPSRFASLGVGGTTFQIKGNYEDSYGVNRGKTSNDKGVLVRMGLHLPVTEWLHLDTYINLTGGEILNGNHYLYSASIHF